MSVPIRIVVSLSLLLCVCFAGADPPGEEPAGPQAEPRPAAAASPALDDGFFIPSTVSEQAQARIRTFSRAMRDSIKFPPPDDLETWAQFQAMVDASVKPINDAIVAKYQPQIAEAEMGGVPVLDIRPKDWSDNGKVLIYLHGGGLALYRAASSLMISVPMAEEAQMRIIAVDYTLAPAARYGQIMDEVIAVVGALRDEGYAMRDIAMFGDSAGGSLTAGVALKLRDDGHGLLGAIACWSGWHDVTETGDTYATLKDSDPTIAYGDGDGLHRVIEAFGDPKLGLKHPYISPAYGDYGPGFPPALIQVGTKEVILSCSVRLYQAIDQAGGDVKLDVYEGMWHVWQRDDDLPEARIARAKTAAFIRAKLGR